VTLLSALAIILAMAANTSLGLARDGIDLDSRLLQPAGDGATSSAMRTRLLPPADQLNEAEPSISCAPAEGQSPSLSASAQSNALPDLIPHAPRGSSYPVTPSSVQGTRTANALYAGQPTYFDLALLNQGGAPTALAVATRLYIDGERIATWEVGPLPVGWYAQATDLAHTVTSPGWHTVRLIADEDGALPEADEWNNAWEYRFFWLAATLPNVQPNVSESWPQPVVLSSLPDGRVAPTLYANQPAYVDWSIANRSSLSTGHALYTQLYLDGQQVGLWRTDLLLPNWEAVIEDWPLTVSEPGWHTIRLVADAWDSIAESDEADNVWEGEFFWQASDLPNLQPQARPGWPAPLVLSSTPGDSGSGTVYAGQPLYFDWSIANDSAGDVYQSFEVYLYLDGLRIAAWPIHGLAAHEATGSLDWVYMTSTPGWHTLALVADAGDTVPESDEGDNAWEARVWFQQPEARSVGVEWVNNYHQSGLPPLLHNHLNANGFADELDRVGWKDAFSWGDASAWEKDFKDASKGGVDNQAIDSVAFGFFSGHGRIGGFLFDTMEDDNLLHHSDALWGDGALNWLVVDACLVLNNADGQVAQRWGPAFGGLHMMLGFDTECMDSPYRGQNLARYADGSYWWEAPLSIRDAWFQAAAVTEGSGTYSAALIAVEPDIDPTDDRLPGLGGYSADPKKPTEYHYWRVQN
jgi:hypothetical protein